MLAFMTQNEAKFLTGNSFQSVVSLVDVLVRRIDQHCFISEAVMIMLSLSRFRSGLKPRSSGRNSHHLALKGEVLRGEVEGIQTPPRLNPPA
jgi:hypothetical protein